MELPCHPFGAYNFVVHPSFLEDLWTPDHEYLNMLKLAASLSTDQKTNRLIVTMPKQRQVPLLNLLTVHLITLSIATTTQVVELWVNNELERLWKEQSCHNLRYYPGIFLDGFRKTTKSVSRPRR